MFFLTNKTVSCFRL